MFVFLNAMIQYFAKAAIPLFDLLRRKMLFIFP